MNEFDEKKRKLSAYVQVLKNIYGECFDMHFFHKELNEDGYWRLYAMKGLIDYMEDIVEND